MFGEDYSQILCDLYAFETLMHRFKKKKLFMVLWVSRLYHLTSVKVTISFYFEYFHF